MTAPKRKLSYYRYDRVCSYNAVINIIAGARGLGKTWGAKERALRAAIKRGEQFIYLRRYKEELKTARATFLADIEYKFPDHDFRVNGWAVELAPAKTRDEKKRQWKIAGYFLSLSTAQSVKSASFEKVTTIIFDEFIIEKGAFHYLKDEVTVLLNFYNTVDRWQDKTTVFMLSNSVSIMNPYFLAWKISPDETRKEIISLRNNFIVCHFPDAKNFQSEVNATRFGQFIQGTEYADYAVGNEFRDNGKSLVEQKDPDARYRFTLETSKGSFSIWMNNKTLMNYAQKDRPKQERIFTLVPERMSSDRVLVTFNSKSMQSLRAAFRTGNLMFDDPSTRNALAEVFTR